MPPYNELNFTPITPLPKVYINTVKVPDLEKEGTEQETTPP